MSLASISHSISRGAIEARLRGGGADFALSNVALGNGALQNNVETATLGLSNVAVGLSALFNNTDGQANTAVGRGASVENTVGRFNTAIGYASLQEVTAGDFNTGVGTNAINGNISGNPSVKGLGSNNTALGASSLYNNDTGEYNVAVGANAAQDGRTASRNIAIGVSSLILNRTGFANISIGYLALSDLLPTSGAISAFADHSGTVPGTVRATSVGHGRSTGNSLVISGTLDYNGTHTITVIDANSFYFTETFVATDTGWWQLATQGEYNTVIGYGSGDGIVTGSGNTIIGANVTGLAAGLVNNIILANGAGTIKARHDGTNWVLTGACEVTGTIKTAAPNTPAALWKLGSASVVSPTAPNRTIEVDVGGTLFYIHAKTTND